MSVIERGPLYYAGLIFTSCREKGWDPKENSDYLREIFRSAMLLFGDESLNQKGFSIRRIRIVMTPVLSSPTPHPVGLTGGERFFPKKSKGSCDERFEAMLSGRPCARLIVGLLISRTSFSGG